MNTSRILAITGLTTSAAVLGIGGFAAATTQPAEPTTDLARASEAALAEVGDGVVVAYSVERRGYEVEVVLADGTVVEVRLDDDFTVAQVIGDADDDDTLTSAQVATLADVDLRGAHDAALAEAGNGVVVDLDWDEEDGGYDAEIDLDDRSTLEVELGADLGVISTETDD